MKLNITYIILINCINFIQFVNSKNNYIEGMIINKNEVLKIIDEQYISFQCKDDICILVDVDYNNSIIEFPNKNGGLIKYIIKTCRSDNINNYDCPIICYNNSECLSNSKCYNHHCIFNNETSIDHCDNIYSNFIMFGKSSHIYCSKPYNNICKN